jgi:hypothetical protein
LFGGCLGHGCDGDVVVCFEMKFVRRRR